jgi:hypothetical protein
MQCIMNLTDKRHLEATNKGYLSETVYFAKGGIHLACVEGG